MNTRKFLKYFSIYDIIFLIAAAVIFIFAVFFPPVHSVADQGDFERVMRPIGIDFPDDYSFYEYAVRFFPMRFTKQDLLLYIPRLLFIVPSTAFVFPSLIVRLICAPTGMFDMRILAAVIFLWYTLSCFFILRRIKIKNCILHIAFIGFFLIVFFNGVNLTLFNSLYGQSVMLASFASVAAASLYLFENIRTATNLKIFIFTIASCLMIDSKLQCFIFAPFFAALIIYAGFKSNRRVICVLCAAVIMWHGIGGYFINSINTGKATLYNSIFYGILKDSDTPEKDLAELGLSPEFSANCGKHAFLQPTEYSYPPTDENFYSKVSNITIIKFYLSHPVRLISAMENTAKDAFCNKISLGTFEEKYGFKPYASSYRFTLWENIRSHLPHALLFIIPVWLIFIAFAVFKRKNVYFPIIIAMFLMGAVQFPMPYIGNGAADISKQLFMFNIIFDSGISIILYSMIKRLDNFFQKKY